MDLLTASDSEKLSSKQQTVQLLLCEKEDSDGEIFLRIKYSLFLLILFSKYFIKYVMSPLISRAKIV